MKKAAKILGAVAVIGILSACTGPEPIERRVTPVTAKVERVCVQENPRVYVKDFRPALYNSLRAAGVEPVVYDSVAPEDCLHYLTYSAKRRRDEVPYMAILDIKVRDKQDQVGDLWYYVRGFARDQSRYDPPETVIKPMIAQLFPNG